MLKVLSIFLLVALGLLAKKLKLVPDNAVDTLNKFVLNIAAPCLVIHTMQRDENTNEAIGDMLWAFVAFIVVTIVLAILVSLALRKIKTIKQDDKGIYAMQIVFTNAGFMGYPLTQSIFGSYAFLIAVIMNVGFGLLVYSLGVAMLIHKKGERVITKKMFREVLSIPMVSSLVGLLIFATNFHFPEFLDNTLELMGASLSPIAMFVVGLNLSESKFKDFVNHRTLILCIFSLIIVPGLTLAIDLLLPLSDIVIVTHVFLMAMPAPALTTILCHRYGKNTKLGAEGIASTTLVSLFTLALWAVILSKLFL